MRGIKEFLLCVYWMPATMRTIWKHTNGGFFIFREECDEFLRFVSWAASPSAKEDWQRDYLAQCLDEIAMRQRRGDWKYGSAPC